MRTIAIGLSPNTQWDDVFLTLRRIFSPWSYQEGSSIGTLEQWFKQYFQVSYAVSFHNARSALYVVLKSLGVQASDEVILQAFTCVVVPNSIVAVGALPVYADITDEFVIDPKEVEKKITKKTKAILVQHTFGIPTNMHEILRIAKKHKLFVIEDVAHTIGGKYKEKKLGTLGDAAIFSFGRDKAFSSVFGGIAITSNKKLGEKIRDFQKKCEYPNVSWIRQQLFHPLACSIILPSYTSGVGKLLLIFLQQLRLLSFPVMVSERKGIFDPQSIRKFPNALAALAMHQISKIEKYNARRKEIFQKYQRVCQQLHIQHIISQEEPLLRFPIIVEDPTDMKMYFRKHGKMYIGDWYANVIDPKGSNYASIKYKLGMSPRAEMLSKKVINIPSYPVMTNEDVEKVITLIKKYYSQNNTI